MTRRQTGEIVHRAIFLDRDGVINTSRPDYVKRWDEFEFIPGVLESLRRLSETPFLLPVVTNQSAIARGLVPALEVEEIHHRMVAEILAAGGRIDGVYCCPHGQDDGCQCRKPKPGLLLRAARELGIDLNRSYCLGDKLSDLEAGMRAGCHAIMVLTGEGRPLPGCALNYSVARDLDQAIDLILDMEALSS
jgi:D-glycero-D-manno-heptose 1,7-bisphosphate phosphatase